MQASSSTPGVARSEERRESVEEPAKLMRIGSMIKQLLEEVRDADLDDAARERLKEIYDDVGRASSAAPSPTTCARSWSGS